MMLLAGEEWQIGGDASATRIRFIGGRAIIMTLLAAWKVAAVEVVVMKMRVTRMMMITRIVVGFNLWSHQQ